MLVVTPEQMQSLDRQTIDDLGLPGVVLMENAGRACAEQVLLQMGDPPEGRVVVLCGHGNNGGDGFVVARHLHQKSVPVAVILAADPERIRGDARINFDFLRRLPVPILPVADEPLPPEIVSTLAQAQVIVDALLGTGLRSAVSGVLAALIDLANRTDAWRMAVDIPSGVRGSDGAVLSLAFRAHRTVTLALPKLGLVLFPGADYAGEVICADIGIPPHLLAQAGLQTDTIERREAEIGLLPRPRDGHKGTFGHCLLFAGSPGKGGAALLAGLAALKTGAGLVTLATDSIVQQRLEGRVPELMIESFRPDSDAPVDPNRLQTLLAHKTAVAIGPGLGTAPATVRCVRDVLDLSRVPVIVDADGLNALSEFLDDLPAPLAPWVLTPHPGEMARLVRQPTAAVQADRMTAARDLARRLQAVVALKGARTVVAAPDGRAGLLLQGNPGMATAGSGDALTGMITGLIGQGLQPYAATRLAVWLHGMAGDQAAARCGQRALLATDILEHLTTVLREFEEQACRGVLSDKSS